MITRLMIYCRVVRHCTTYDEFCYIRELCAKFLSEEDFSLFLNFCATYFFLKSSNN